jgi:outer membrane protein OmpA-like peptidoglycan-associated protein
MTRRLALTALVLTFVTAAALPADELSVAPTATGESGLFTLFTGDTLERGAWSTGIWFSNVDRQIEFPGLPDAVAGFDQSTVRVSVGYGITDAWEAAVSLPYEDFNFDSRLSGLSDDASGLGNLRLGTKFRVLGQRNDPTTMAVNFFLEPETGDEDVVGRDSDTGFGGGLDWRLNQWVLNVGYHEPGDDSERLLAGVGYIGTVSDRLDWITELAGTFFDNSFYADAYDLTTGGRMWLGDEQNVAFNFGLRTDLNQLSSIDEHCPVGGLLSFAFLPAGRASRMAAAETAAADRPTMPPPTAPGTTPPGAPRTPGMTAPGTTAPGAVPPPGSPSATPPATTTPAPGTPGAPGAPGTPGTPGAPGAAPAPTGPRPSPVAPPAAPAAPAEVETIDFPAGGSRMSNVAKAKLDEVALQLKQDPRLRAYIVGHADASGSESLNQRLSLARADAAKEYLVSRHGLDPTRITTEGRGSSEATGDAMADRHITVTVRLP